jgi:DNA ligase-1
MMRYKPMLAYPVSDKPIDYTNKVSMQPKLDGVRCLIQYDKKQGVTAWSRTGKQWKNIMHITKSLEKWFQSNQTTVLDGELYNHDLRDDFEQIISIVRRQNPDDIDMLESQDMVQFHCYDIIHPINSAFEDRNRFIRCCVPETNYVKHVKTQAVGNEALAKVVHQQNLDNGYEGSILRTNDEYQNKRTHSLRKFKDFQDDEALILDWVEGLGKRAGTIGKFMAQDIDGNVFGIPVMDKFKYLQDNFEEMKTWVGKFATFTYFERTKAGSYRHPLFKCIRDYE